MKPDPLDIVDDRVKPLVLYHGDCWDGFCAAWVARMALGDIEAVPVFYGQPAPDVAGREVYVLDFSYPFEMMAEMASASSSLVVLDHHTTARAAIADLNAMFITHNMVGHTQYATDQSGGRMAWEYFARIGGWQSMASPWLVDYTEDRDLWRHALPDSKAINAALRSYPLEFDLWDDFHTVDPQAFVKEGKAILRREQQIIQDHVRKARRESFGHWRVPVVNATVLFSEIAGELAQGESFAATYFDRSDGKRQWSLRSTAEGVDVSVIAKQRGGGGHAHAAGFEETV